MAVVDVMMPWVDGFEVTKWIRKNHRSENMLVVLMTAMAKDRHVFEGFDYGADKYIVKPINPADIFG
jgi:DNA-binding response OmpR family regulator